MNGTGCLAWNSLQCARVNVLVSMCSCQCARVNVLAHAFVACCTAAPFPFEGTTSWPWVGHTRSLYAPFEAPHCNHSHHTFIMEGNYLPPGVSPPPHTHTHTNRQNVASGERSDIAKPNMVEQVVYGNVNVYSSQYSRQDSDVASHSRYGAKSAPPPMTRLTANGFEVHPLQSAPDTQTRTTYPIPGACFVLHVPYSVRSVQYPVMHLLNQRIQPGQVV